MDRGMGMAMGGENRRGVARSRGDVGWGGMVLQIQFAVLFQKSLTPLLCIPALPCPNSAQCLPILYIK
jgi:hypothetical protein